MRKCGNVDQKVVLADDRSGLEALQGFLMKKSTRGSWQKRYFCVSNQFLNYFGSQKMLALKASCDLCELLEEPSLVGRFGEFLLRLPDGDVALKAKSLKQAGDWVRCLCERRAYFESGPGSVLVQLSTSAAQGDNDANTDDGQDAPDSAVSNGSAASHASRTKNNLPRSMPSSIPNGADDQRDDDGHDVERKDGASPQQSAAKLRSASGSQRSLGRSQSGSSLAGLSAEATAQGAKNLKNRVKKITTRKTTTVKARDTAWEALAASKCAKSGMLMKKSPSRFKAWQARHFRLIEGGLYYYKSERHPFGNFQGRIAIDKACEVVRGPDGGEGDDGVVFLIKTPLRTFELKAESDAVRAQWTAAIEAQRAALEERVREEIEVALKHEDEKTAIEQQLLEEALIEERVPDWMVEWDETEHVDRLEKIQLKLENKFAGSSENLDTTLAAATGLIEELDELAAQCLGLREPRADILTVFVRLYHMRVEHEIGYYLVGERFQSLSINDMLRLMDLITAYDDFLRKLLEGEHGQRLRDELPPNSMTDHVDRMAERYLFELQDSHGTWVENIIRTHFARGESCVESLSQGSSLLCTSAPVDIFNMINETLVMAKASGVDQVQGAVLTCCLVTIADYISNLMHDIQRTERGKLLAKDLRFLCAVTNDCHTVIDHLDSLEKGEFGVPCADFGIDWEPVRVKYEQAALGLINLIIDMVHADLEQLYVVLFTSGHLDVGSENIEANVMARIAVTVQDYLSDIRMFLFPAYFSKLVRLLVRDIVVKYCSRLVASTPVYERAQTLVEEVLPEKQRYSALDTFSTLQSSSRLSLDDIFHIRADKDGILGELAPFVSDAEKFFAKEFALLDDILDLLAVSPEFFPSAVVKMCAGKAKVVQRAVVATALACLSLRLDVTSAQSSQIRHAISTSLQEAAVARHFTVLQGRQDESDSAGQFEAQLYHRLWPDLTLSASVSDKIFNLARVTKMRMSVVREDALPPADAAGAGAALLGLAADVLSRATKAVGQKPIPEGAAQEEPRPAAASGRKRGSSLLEAVSLDISDDAVMARKQHRLGKLDTTEDIRDIDLHGYLDKKSASAPHPWQRRWFVVHKAQDVGTKQWRVALSWHKTHSAPVKSRVFLDEVERIELVSALPVRLAADGISLVLIKEQLPKKNTGSSRYEFQVITSQHAYSLRATSMSETITWVNGLNKASREARRLAAAIKSSEDAWRSKRHSSSVGGQAAHLSSLNMAQLRSLCASKGIRVDPNATPDELVALLQEAARVETDKNAMAERVDGEEKKKLLLSKSIRELRDTCQEHGLDAGEYMEKSELVTLIASSTNAGAVPREEAEGHLRQLIARGLQLLEEAEGDAEAGAAKEGTAGGNLRPTSPAASLSKVETAVGIFERVAREANELGNRLIEARAFHGLASAYSISDDRRAAAPLMFEMASGMFFTAGEKSDARSCVMDASEMYRIAGQYEDAVRVLVEFDTKAKSLEFSSMIEQLRLELQRKNKPVKTSRFSHLFVGSSSRK